MQISAVTGLDDPPHVTIHGSEGTLRFTQNKLLGGKRGEKELKEIPIPDHEVGKWRVEEEFVNAIRGREPITMNTFETGVRYMEWTEAVHRSAATGAAVDLPLA